MKRTAPLNALRAFEAAARTGSFTKAARELNVSAAAVSQQVKLLEEFWDETLFIRQGNRISLTDSGQMAYPELAGAITRLSDLSDRMQRTNTRRKRLVLSAPPSVAETWLARKLSKLGFDNLETPLGIRIEEDPVDFQADRIDMRVFYGHDLYGDYQVVSLFSDVLVAVASPQLAAQYSHGLIRVPDRCFIHTDWGPGFASSPDWNTALDGRRIIDRSAGQLVGHSSTALSFARNGLGVALVPQEMAATDLKTGNITKMDLSPITLPQDYLIAYPKRLKSHPDVQKIVGSLQNG
ncbi:LysR family transcriptional regulator [Ruegeria sp. Ofav3-42]|uniref:LysR family transcriptional regulator n=1 Tax=Ruegeria sp. Ofav3-42 TaxID=2917759 RepID=UPI001EF5119D|nr:LysR family transcriptional regulator [Ruegeria sp. Ofav3-42]MCG7519882.1 LysR family transcriptional regulator [Ruegeria sp. Ofav3-42]